MAERSVTLRRRLVRELESRGLIRTPAVRAAFLAVPRELFVPEAVERSGLAAVYQDEAIPTKFAPNGAPLSSSSQPAIMAQMLERLALAPGMRVLEIGAGTGYNAGLLSHLVGQTGRVDTIDLDAEIAQRARKAVRAGGYRIRVHAGDGHAGHAARAPYDRIVVTASSDTVPHAWFDQLVTGGIVEVPLRLREAGGAHAIVALRKSDHGLRSVSTLCGGFMPLRGAGEPELPRSMRSLAVTDMTGDTPRPIRQISGIAVAGLSEAAKRRLLSVSLERPRRRRLGIRANVDALVLYLSTTLPVRQSVTVLPDWGVGLIGGDGRGLAYVAWQPTAAGSRTISSLTAYGSATAEQRLVDAIRRWKELGRPSPDRLVVAVSYDGTRPRLRSRWQ
jgi:protein-L-isoaspartate(D-aspartate) O-methyltransferase